MPLAPRARMGTFNTGHGHPGYRTSLGPPESPMDRASIVVVLAVGLVVLPVALVGLAIPVDRTVVNLVAGPDSVNAAGQILHLPSNVRSGTAGVLTWLGLAALAVLLGRDLRLLAPPPGSRAPAGAPEARDGPRPVASAAPDGSFRGLVHVGVAALLTVVAAALLLQEGMGAARNQVLGLEMGLLLLALAETIVAYAVHFRPRFAVADLREGGA